MKVEITKKTVIEWYTFQLLSWYTFRLLSTGFPINRLNDALKNRIIIYSGGGSTYKYLRRELLTFSDVKHVSNKIWEGMTIDEINEYVALCPILSTSLGLAISEMNDDVQLSTTEVIFKHLEGEYMVEERPRPKWV